MVALREAPAGIITYSLEIEERIAGLEAEVAHYRGLYDDLYQKYTFITNLDEADPEKLTTSHKATVRATVRYMDRHKEERDERGYIKMNGYDVAAMAGHSYGTVLKHWGETSRELRIHDGIEVEADIGRVPIFDRLVVRVPTTDRERYPQGYRLETYIRERTNTFHPERYRAQTPIEWGGKRKNAGRKKCKKCGVWMKPKDHIRTMQREHICPSCNRHEWDEVQRVSPDMPTTPDNGEPVNKPVEQPEASKNQVDFCWPDPLDDAEIDASKPPLDEVEEDEILHQVAVAEPPPSSTNAPRGIGEYPLNGLSLESLLEQRIGCVDRIITSTGKVDQNCKYVTKPEGYKPDIAAYLRGDLLHIYGSRPRQENERTHLLGFDCDTPELDGQHLEWMMQLAAAGISSVYWNRRPGRGHLEIYFDGSVDRRAAYAHLLNGCPGLAAVPEVFPIGSDQNVNGQDRSDYGYSWPLYYRIGNAVTECEAEIMTPGDLLPMKSTGIQSDRARLTWLLNSAINAAALIPALPQNEVIQAAARAVGALLDKTPDVLPTRNYPNDVAKIAIAERKAALTWEEVAAPVGGLQGDRFCSPLHEDDTPSVVIRGDYATDFGRTPSGKVETRDKFDWYCLARGLDRREEKRRVIQAYRQEKELVSA